MHDKLEEMLKTYLKELKNRNYAKNTIQNYKRHLKGYFEYSEKHREAPEKRISDYLEKLQKSPESLKNAYYAISTFYKLVLKKECPYILTGIRKKHRRPDIMCKSDIEKFLNTIKNKKHRLMISLLYGSGLRVSEVPKIKVKHLSFKEKTLFIKDSKQNSDRLTVLSAKLIPDLENLCKGKEKNDYVFLTNKGTPYSKRTLQKIFEKTLSKLELPGQLYCHSLRHSFATHLIENGYHVYTVQELLGHQNMKTTMIYVHLADPSARKVESPL